MNSIKISEFYKKLEQSGNVDSTLREKIQRIKNEDDLRKIIEDEIIPLSRKMGMDFTSDELMDYEKRVSRTLSDTELENISGGLSNKGLFLGGLVSLMFLGLGSINAKAINAKQATCLSERMLISSEYGPNEESKVSSLGKRALKAQAKSAGTTSVKEKLTPDRQPTTLETEGNPAKRPGLNQAPTDSTEVVANPEGQTVLNQLQPTSTEGTETNTISQSTNPIDGVGGARDVGTDDHEVRPGISVDQVLAVTPGVTDTTQTVEAVAEPSDGIYSVSLQKLINEQKLYCIEALNLCYPFIYNTIKLTANLRSDNGYIESINMVQANPDDPIKRKYTNDSGKGSANVMNFLFPSPSGDLNVAAGSEKVDNLDKLSPTPERLARILSVLYNYRVCRENGIRTERLNPKTDRVCRKLGITDDEKETKETANLHHKYCPKDMYLNFIQDAEYMIENQEKNGFSKDEEVRIFPKYTTERLIISYFLKKFDKDEDIKRFYDEINKQLKDESTPKLRRNVTEKEFSDAKKNLEETIQMLKRCNIAASDYSPYKEATKENSTCPAIKDISYGKISFGGAFSDCADIAARHVFNLLLYSQGKIDHPDDPWANILPAEGSDEEKDLEKKLEEISGAITDALKGEEKKVSFYPLKDRLQMFFLHQKKVGADAGDEVTRTLWEYAICNLTEPDGEIGRVNYVRGKIYELETGYKNMLTLMCRCAKALFPEKEKDIEAAYEKVKDCPEYKFNANLTSAITDVFKLFNQHNPVVTSSNDKVSIVYSDLGNLGFHINQLDFHGKVDYKPAANKTILTKEEISAIEKSENDFTKMYANFVVNSFIELHEDFHKLFFGEGFYYDDYYLEEFNLTLSSDKITDSDFLSRYQALRFLKYSQGEENNIDRIMRLLREHVRPHIDSSLIMRLPSGETTNFRDFVVGKYRESFSNVCDYLKGFELINRNNEVTITSFGTSVGWAKNNTNTKFRYTLDENGNAILYPMEDKENLYIPSTITTKKGTFNVSGIGYRACYSSEFLKKVVIEGGATAFQIEQGAFGRCKNLESITIPDSVSDLQIGKEAFSECGNSAFSQSLIELIILPKNVKNLTIGESAFTKCPIKCLDLSSYTELESIVISDSAFRESYIESIILPKNVKNLTIGESAFAKCPIKCLDLSPCAESASIVIGDSAFSSSRIKTIILPKKVKTLKIGVNAFEKCHIECLDLSSYTELESIVISDSAFRESYIESIILPKNVKNLTIGESAFAKCPIECLDLSSYTELESIVIGDSAFERSCIKSIILPKNVKNLTIGRAAFVSCTIECLDLSSYTELESIVIGDEAFSQSLIESIILPKNVKNLTIGKWAFCDCQYFTGLDLSSCTVLESVLIEYSAFNGCRNFVMFKLSPNLKSLVINDKVFSCLPLKEFIVPDSVKYLRIGNETFARCRNLEKVKIPSVEDSFVDSRAFVATNVYSLELPEDMRQRLVTND